MKQKINSGQLTGISTHLGTLVNYNKRFIPISIFLELFPILPKWSRKYIIKHRLHRVFPSIFYLKLLSEVFGIIVRLDFWRFREVFIRLKKLLESKSKVIHVCQNSNML